MLSALLVCLLAAPGTIHVRVEGPAREVVAYRQGDECARAAVAQAENMLSGVLRQFFALSESYPDLKANQNMLSLQEELASTENRIAFARQHYNDSVRRYNTKLEQVPTNIVKNFGDFPPLEFFEIEDAAQREVPKVQF